MVRPTHVCAHSGRWKSLDFVVRMRHLPLNKENFSPILIAPLVQVLFHRLCWWQRPPRAAFLAYGRYCDHVRVHARVYDRGRDRDRDRVLERPYVKIC